MASPRDIPGWLRIILNIVAIVGVGTTVTGFVQKELGYLVGAIALIYLMWEIGPWVSNQVRRRAGLSLISFTVVGALSGAAVWFGWRSVIHRKPVTTHSLSVAKMTPELTWINPSPIPAGIQLSTNQLNATSAVPGHFSYNPDLGTILAAGTHPLHVDFQPEDSSNYSPASKTVYLVVNPASPSTPKLKTEQAKPAELPAPASAAAAPADPTTQLFADA